jgi:hypothetical protein
MKGTLKWFLTVKVLKYFVPQGVYHLTVFETTKRTVRLKMGSGLVRRRRRRRRKKMRRHG